MTKPDFLRPAAVGRRVLLAAAVAALALPAAASAAPDRTYTLSAATAEAAWDGPTATGSYDPIFGSYDPTACTKEPESYCDQTLVKVESGGPVTIDAAIGSYSDPLADFDLYVYQSDPSGSATDGEELHDSWQTGGDSGWPNSFEESATIENAEPGYYLMVVVYYDAQDATYKGSFKVTGATPVEGGSPSPSPNPSPSPSPSPSPGPAPSPSPSPSPGPSPEAGPLPFKAASVLGSAKKAKKSRKLVFKVKAGEAITNLRLVLTKGKRSFGKATVKSLPAGTRKIKLKVSRKLKAGRYQLAAAGLVNGQERRTAQKVRIRK